MIIVLEGNTLITIRLETDHRAVLRAISEDLYDGDHNYGPLLQNICNFAVHEFMREYKDSKKSSELMVHKDNLKELRDIIIVNGLPKIQNEITGIEVPIARSFFDKMFEKP